MMGTLPQQFLDLSQVSVKLSLSFWAKLLISILICAVLAGGQYFVKKIWTKSAQLMMESSGSEVSHCLAQSLKDNGNSLSRMASSVTPLYFTLLHTSKNLVK